MSATEKHGQLLENKSALSRFYTITRSTDALVQTGRLRHICTVNKSDSVRANSVGAGRQTEPGLTLTHILDGELLLLLAFCFFLAFWAAWRCSGFTPVWKEQYTFTFLLKIKIQFGPRCRGFLETFPQLGRDNFHHNTGSKSSNTFADAALLCDMINSCFVFCCSGLKPVDVRDWLKPDRYTHDASPQSLWTNTLIYCTVGTGPERDSQQA